MNNIIEEFRRTFVSFGYTEEKEAKIYPCPDKTTLFTCATISVFKSQLLNNNLGKKFLVQPCLRTQNIKRILDDGFDPEYLSSFVMVGMLCPIQSFDQECVSHLFESFSDLRGKILVRSSREFKEKVFESVADKFQIEYDRRQSSYYKWMYGEDSLSGNGITFAIKQPDGNFLDVGNLVIVYSCNNPVAVEFGFGQETFTARQNGLASPYAASEIYLNLGLGMSPSEKRLGDAMITALRLVENGILPGTGKASSIVRKTLRNICFLAIEKYKQSAEQMICELAKKVSSNTSWQLIVNRVMSNVLADLAAFRKEVNHISRHANGKHLDRKIEEYRIRYRIPNGLKTH